MRLNISTFQEGAHLKGLLRQAISTHTNIPLGLLYQDNYFANFRILRYAVSQLYSVNSGS